MHTGVTSKKRIKAGTTKNLALKAGQLEKIM
jgi:hypothetical protein